MKCKEILAALSDYMDGDLDPDIRQALEEHLADCNPCQLVVDNVILENYCERDKPIYPTGQIELQSHGSTLYFRNVFIREISKKRAKK